MKKTPIFILTLMAATSVNAAPSIGGCNLFPDNNIWNTPIKDLPKDSNPAHQVWIDAIGRDKVFHMDFASGTYQGKTIGIPINKQAQLPINPTKCSKFTFLYGTESDNGAAGCFLDGKQGTTGYAIPSNVLIEGGSDHHLLVVEQSQCMLYEVFNAAYNSKKNTGTGGSGAIWNLKSNQLRPLGWTSADAAGLPITAGLVRYDEAAAGKINHAIRFTVPATNGAYIWPASHKTGTYSPTSPNPPMGARLRLTTLAYNRLINDPVIKQIATNNDVTIRNIMDAMKDYGIINADNGSAWFISGEPHAKWNNTNLKAFADRLSGKDFEAVDTSCMMVAQNSGEVRADYLTRCNPPIAAASTPNCTYTISPSSNSFTKAGGTGKIVVTASASTCNWSVGSHDAWISLTNHNYTGSQVVNYSVSANTTGIFRTANFLVAGQSFIASQAQ